MKLVWLILTSSLTLASVEVVAQINYVRIGDYSGGFTGVIEGRSNDFDPRPDFFGAAVVNIGDLDGDGNADLAVGAPGDDDGDYNLGAVWILFMDDGGSVRNYRKLSAQQGGIKGLGPLVREFGNSLAYLGRVDSTSEAVLAVGTVPSKPGFVLFLGQDGAVTKQFTISSEVPTSILDYELFAIGDLDRNGVNDIAIGPLRLSGGPASAIQLIFFDRDFTVRRDELLLEETPGFPSDFYTAANDNVFSQGIGIAPIGDLNEDGFLDLAIGDGVADYSQICTPSGICVPGAIWILFLGDSDESNDLIRSRTLIDAKHGGLLRGADTPDYMFGDQMGSLGDINNDGVNELVASSSQQGDYIIYLNRDGTVRAQQRIDVGVLSGFSGFGTRISSIGDLDGDGNADLAVTADGNNVFLLYGLADLAPGFGVVQLSTPDGGPPTEDAEVTFKIDVVSANEPEVQLSFRRGGDPTFFSIEMAHMGSGRFEASIPEFAVGSRGIEYFVSARGSSGTSSRMPESGFISLPVAVPDGLTLTIPLSPEPPQYRLVSFPVEITDASVTTAIEDDLGLYDPTRWRLVALDAGNSFVDYGEEPFDLETGRGYFLIVRDENRTLNTGPGVSVPTADVYQVPLNEGWNLVGNPFHFDIPKSNLRLSSGQGIDLWAYDGSWTVETEQMRPFQGYAVFAETLTTLIVNPNLTPSDSSVSPSLVPTQRDRRASRLQLESMVADLRRLHSEFPDGHARALDASVHVYPNPFTTKLTITYELMEPRHVRFELFDVIGRRLAVLDERDVEVGLRSYEWDGNISGRRLASGVYILQMLTRDFSETLMVTMAD